MDAFDADVLIYAATSGHPLGRRVLALLPDEADAVGGPACVGSVLLVPEVMAKPMRAGAHEQVRALATILGRLQLVPVDQALADLATGLGAKYGLKAVDAVHLATAVSAGADRFHTNNERDFPGTIDEIDVVYPRDLTDPGA